MSFPDNIFTLTVSETVLAAEENDGRFENFCRAVVSELEGGAVVLSTSKSWDLGRDGVGFGSAQGLFVCCSLRDDVDAKALSDIHRLLETTKGIKLVYFCSSHKLSEHRRNGIETELRNEVDNGFDIVCLGSTQLSEVAIKHPHLLENSYGAEISNCLRAIKSDPDDETEIKGLRLALISSIGDDSRVIREEIYKSSLLDVLKDGSSKSLNNCCKNVSESLRLRYNIAPEAIQPHLATLCAAGFVDCRNGFYVITSSGLELLGQREMDAAKRLVSGRVKIREAIEASLGYKLIEDQFNTIWSIFEERIAEYFMSRGAALVEEVSDILGEDDIGGLGGHHVTSIAPYSFLDDLAAAVAATSSHRQQRDELQQAIKDLFKDRTSVATDWLVRLSASFLAACALGLEYSSNAALKKLFGRTTLVFDTDVLLSLLGQGEPDHESVHTIAKRWTQLGGKLLVAEPVLEEAAHHASIAQRDFDQVMHLIPGTPEDRLHIIENAFVRSFAELISQRKAKINQWRTYIGQYRGASGNDWSSIYAAVSTEYSIRKLPPRSSQEEELEQQVRRYMVKQAESRSTSMPVRILRDKAGRDAQLYAALVHYVKVLKDADPGATCLLVSSARRLASAEAKFHESGEQQLIVSVSTVLYLLSMLPDVTLGLSAMKAFLFEERRSGFSSELERMLLRMVKSSQEISMPWAKRGTLMREVRDRLVADAESKGERGSERSMDALERKALKVVNEKRTIEILRDSLDAVAVDTRTARENRDLRAKVLELERKLHEQSRRRR